MSQIFVKHTAKFFSRRATPFFNVNNILQLNWLHQYFEALCIIRIFPLRDVKYYLMQILKFIPLVTRQMSIFYVNSPCAQPLIIPHHQYPLVFPY